MAPYMHVQIDADTYLSTHMTGHVCRGKAYMNNRPSKKDCTVNASQFIRTDPQRMMFDTQE